MLAGMGAEPLLPVAAWAEIVKARVQQRKPVVLKAPTGSGKSTRVPVMVADALPEGLVIVLEPRRLAARLLARHVAHGFGEVPGQRVGYAVRHDHAISRETRILFVTEGLFLRRLAADAQLQGVAAVIFDEFHERNVATDVALARVKLLRESCRPDLAVLVMSATMDPGPVAQWLGADELEVEGRTFPVEIEYLKRPAEGGVEMIGRVAALETGRILSRQGEGDVLVFLPGAREIYQCLKVLEGMRETKKVRCLPLFSDLSPSEQDAALQPTDQRKVIVATNVAETSLTIEGVRWVVDGGYARQARFDPFRGLNTLWIQRISRASADQRAGRAGRTAPGVAVRLWTAEEHTRLEAQTAPEIQRVELSEIILGLYAAGVDFDHFPWFQPPEVSRIEAARLLLQQLGALEKGELTELGRRMARWPLHPRAARMLIEAEKRGCRDAVAVLAAAMQERSVLLARVDARVERFREEVFDQVEESDLLRMLGLLNDAAAHHFDGERCRRLGLHAMTARNVARTADQLVASCGGAPFRFPLHLPSAKDLGCCVLTAFSDHLAVRVDGGTLRCRLVGGASGTIDATTSVVRRSPSIVALEKVEVEKSGKKMDTLLRMCHGVEEAWLDEVFPGQLRQKIETVWEPSLKRVVAVRRRSFGELELGVEISGVPDPERAVELLTAQILSAHQALNHWDDEVDQFIVRVQCLARWMPELDLPGWDEEQRRLLLADICSGALSLKEVRDRPVWPSIRAWLSAAQHEAVTRFAPEKVTLPSGREARLRYALDRSPWVSARIQELFGLDRPLFIADGRVRVRIEFLAPNQRPVQVTDDPGSFWKNHYPALRDELQRRYPKHEWR